MLIRVDWTIAAEGDFDPGQSDRAFNLLVSDYTLAPEILKLSAAGAANRSWARRHVYPDRSLGGGANWWVFGGSDEGRRRAAIPYTLIETARLNDIDPEAWLADIIGRTADHQINRVEEMLSWKWRAAASQPIAE